MNYKLSPRESEVYELIKSGYTNLQISEKLEISHQTVKNHITKILYKKKMSNVKSLLVGKDNGGDRRPNKTYMIRVKGTDFVKIGSAVDVDKRLQALQIGCPYELEVVRVINENVEKELHDKYKDKHVRGEWYKLEWVQLEIG